jgi:hypothetical protein
MLRTRDDITSMLRTWDRRCSANAGCGYDVILRPELLHTSLVEKLREGLQDL